MANDGVSFRGRGGFPSLACLVLSDSSLGATGHGRQECHPHDGGEDRKEKTGTGMVRYTGSPRRGKGLIPALPRFLPVQPSSWPLLRAGSSRKSLLCHYGKYCQDIEEVAYAGSKAAVRPHCL